MLFDGEQPAEDKAAGFLLWMPNAYAPVATSLYDVSTLDQRENGFASSARLRRSLILHVLQTGMLEKALDTHNAFSQQVTGDGIGVVSYPTGYAMEAGDPLGSIRQPIARASIKAALKRNGLSVVVDGELSDFHPAEFARHRAERNSQLVPHRTYAVNFIVPWALITARGSTLAHRMPDFVG